MGKKCVGTMYIYKKIEIKFRIVFDLKNVTRLKNEFYNEYSELL